LAHKPNKIILFTVTICSNMQQWTRVIGLYFTFKLMAFNFESILVVKQFRYPG